jgi:hypothetical protein
MNTAVRRQSKRGSSARDATARLAAHLQKCAKILCCRNRGQVRVAGGGSLRHRANLRDVAAHRYSSHMQRRGTEARIAQLKLVLAEIEIHLEADDRRRQSMQSRAGLLIAAAGIAATLIGTSHANGWVFLSVAAAAISAILGVIVIYPATGTSIDAERVRSDVYGLAEGAALLWLIDHKLELLHRAEPVFRHRGQVLRIGFIVFAVAIVFTFLSVTPIQIKF